MRFIFRNLFFQELQRRCNTLITLIEREMGEVVESKPVIVTAADKKKSVAKDLSKSSGTPTAKKVKATPK